MTPSTIEIIVGGTDITHNVLPVGARFDAQMNAVPGTCEFVVRDPDQTMSFTTGDEIEVKLDGGGQWGGYVTSSTRKFALPVVDTSVVADVKARQWVIRGVDYNTLLDKRVLRNAVDYLHSLPRAAAGTMDGALIREALTAAKYYDIDDTDFDVTTEVDDIVPPALPAETAAWPWPDQGTRLRELFDDLKLFSGAVYYFGADKKLYYKALEDVEARWGFSDAPNNAPIDSDPGYQESTIGPREIEAVESGGPQGMVNDAFIWGGSEWSGAGATVFAREDNPASVAEHGLWQAGEHHFGEKGFGTQEGVNARADVIVNGGPVTELPVGAYDPGLRYPQWTFTFTWFAHDVPRVGAVRDHLRAGQLVYIDLHTFGDGVNPLQKVLPLRSLSLSFAGIKEPSGPDYDPADDEIAHAVFRGDFGLQASDPVTLWGHLLGMRSRPAPSPGATVDGSDPAPYGALFTGEPEPATDGVETVFDLPDDRGYIAGTTEVYHDGLLQRRGIEYTESDPVAGEITFVAPPTDWLWIVCRTT